MGVLRTKTLEAIQRDAGDEPGGGEGEGGQGQGGAGSRRRDAGEGHLRKDLRARHLIGLGIGVVIGTGIFTLTGVQAKESAGPAIVISFLIAGVVAMLAALCYAELASAVPTAGSAYSYSYASIGELFAWIIGWDLILECALGASTVARGWSAYVGQLLNLPTSLFGESSVVDVGAVLIVVILTGVAVLGIKESARVSVALTVVKVTICLFVMVLGAWFVRGANLTPFIPPGRSAPAGNVLERPLLQLVGGFAPAVYGWGGVLSAAAVVFFAYTGFEALANMSEETRKPARDMPLSLVGTLLIATLLYIGVSFVLVGMVHYDKIDPGAPIADAFTKVGQSWAATLIALAAIAGLTSVILVDLLTVGRIGYAMGRDGLLPQAVAKVSPKTGVPARLTLFFGTFVAVLSAFVPLSALADMVSIGVLSAFVLVAVAVLVLRRTQPDLHRPFRVPFSPVVPVLTALACVALMLNLEVATWLRFAVWIVIGLVIYGTYGYRHARVGREGAAPSARAGASADR